MARFTASGLFARYVAFAERRRAWLLGGLLALAALALALSLRLELRSDFAELLPDCHPAVVAFRNTVGKQKSASNLVIIVHGPDAAATRRFAAALRAPLEQLVAARLFTDIDVLDAEVPAFLHEWRWLYAARADLEHAEALLDLLIAKRSSPLAVDLEGDPDDELRRFRQSLDDKLPPAPASAYFERDDGGEHWLGIMLWRKRDGLASAGDHEALAAVRAAVAALDPATFGPRLTVEYTGHIAQSIDEQNGIRDDLTVATLLCLGGVLLVIYLYFRRLALLWAIGAPAVLGLLLALALASFTIGALNLNTAFLISIILGNGINSPIIVMARFGEERRAGRPVPAALVTALAETLVGTLTAMAAASIAYGSLLATSFRGFSQFGLLGGSGMLLVWLASFALLPPLVLAGEGWRPGLFTPRDNWFRPAFVAVGRLAERAPRRGLLAIALVSLALLPPLGSFLRDPLEWNLDHLRTEATPAQRLWPRMESLGMGDVGSGYVGNDGVFLVDTPAQAEPVAEAVRRQDARRGPQHLLKTVRTARSLLPAEQADKLALLARVRAKIDRRLHWLSDESAREVQKWRPPDELRLVTFDDLPRQWRDAFTEVDGQRGRFIGVDADRNALRWNDGHSLIRLAQALRVDALGRSWVAASASTIFASMLSAIHDDGPRITVVALAAVTLLVLAMFGPRGALPVLLALAVGIFWLAGLLGVWETAIAPRLVARHGWEAHAKINFMNFVALPITLGVGADYAANLWARARREARPAIAELVGDTGSAVALSSLTTIIGYSTLLLSRNHALRSFGLVADLGEVTCLCAALLVLPLAIRLRRTRAE